MDCVQRKMSWYTNRPIIIQQDGAKPHTGSNNVMRMNNFANGRGWNISVITQPAQSPDLNKLDLCFFHSLQKQSEHFKAGAETLEELFTSVKTAYLNYSMEQLERVDALLFVAYREILENLGGNQYDVPHTGIRKRQKNGEVVADLTVSVQVVRSARQFAR